MKSNISLKDLSKLLKIIINDGHYDDLPQDARTLLNTPRNVNTRNMDNGQYIFVGIKYFLEQFLKHKEITNYTVTLSVSVDGTSVSSSGNNSLWIIFGCLHYDLCTRKAFVIGLFYGSGKPESFNNFLSDTTEELLLLIHNGYTNEEGKTFNVKLKCIVADAPALAAIKYVKSHCGYSACTKCEVKGCYSAINNSVVYNEIDAPLRTDENFRNKTAICNNDSHFVFVEKTVLEKLPIDMIKDFPLDKMHLVDEGVVKRLLILLTTKVNRQKLPPKKITIINDHLKRCEPFMAREFQRRPRSLKYVLKMKATEYR